VFARGWYCDEERAGEDARHSSEAKMTILGVSPMLPVVAIERAIEFYHDILGFKCLSRDKGWACMTRDGIEVMLALPNEHLPFSAPMMTGSLYFKSDDVESLWVRLKDRCEVVYPLENSPTACANLLSTTTPAICFSSDRRSIERAPTASAPPLIVPVSTTPARATTSPTIPATDPSKGLPSQAPIRAAHSQRCGPQPAHPP